MNIYEEQEKERISILAKAIERSGEKPERAIEQATEGIKKYGYSTKRENIPQKTRIQIFQRDNCVCRYCGKTYDIKELQVDHAQPVSFGGGNELRNLVTSCKQCNIRKGNLNQYEFVQIGEIFKQFRKIYPMAKNIRISRNLKKLSVEFDIKAFIEEYSKWEYHA